MQPKDWNKIRNILEEQLAGYIGQDEETVNAKLDALVTSLTGELTANVVKRVQRGVITIASQKASATATINAVNMSKSEISYAGLLTGSDYGGDATATHLVLTNATTVTATRGTTSYRTTVEIPYQVVEYY